MKRNRKLYILFFLLSVIFIFNYGGKVPYIFFHILWVLPLFSLFLLTMSFLHFRYIQKLDCTHAVKGDTVHYSVTIKNSDLFIYPYIRIKFYADNTIFKEQLSEKRFSLYPFKSKTLSFSLKCKYRGYYEVGMQSIEFMDLLGLFKLTHKVRENKVIRVHPKIIQLDNFTVKTNCLSEAHSQMSDKHKDMSTISDIRKYVFGDTFKMIHWKLTAKTNQLMVKNFQSTTDLSTVLVLDLKTNKLEYDQNIIIEDKLIESIIAVSRYCLSNWIPLNLVYYKNGIQDIHAKNLHDFETIYSVLSEIRFNESVDVSNIIDLYLENNFNKTNVMIFSSNVDYQLSDWIEHTRLSGYEMALFYVSPEEITSEKDKDAEEIISYLPETGISTYRIGISDDLNASISKIKAS